MKEIWRDIEGYECKYQVSNLGRVKSLGNDKSRKEKILKNTKNNKGYLFVRLCKNGKIKNCTVHRLVAEAFLPNTENYPCVNHRDENPSNNRVDNLEFCTHEYNTNYGMRNERVSEKLSKPILQINKDTNEVIAEFPSAMEVHRQLGFDNGYISKCCLGRPHRKTAYNFKWRFKETVP